MWTNVPEDVIVCSKCKVEKSEDEFSRHKSRPNGRQANCRECERIRAALYRNQNRVAYRDYQRRWQRFKTYGITAEELDALFDSQGGRCAICRYRMQLWGKHTGDTAHVDHDHDTGLVRGLLCSNCNTALGKFQESPTIMNRAIAYVTAS